MLINFFFLCFSPVKFTLSFYHKIGLSPIKLVISSGPRFFQGTQRKIKEILELFFHGDSGLVEVPFPQD